MSDQADTTRPPDPSVPGLWWMRNGEDWCVWRWEPAAPGHSGRWDTGVSALWLGIDDMQGWTCHSAATPPEDAEP